MGESHIPIRRAETPEEMAAVVAFPASSEAAYITGQTLYWANSALEKFCTGQIC